MEDYRHYGVDVKVHMAPIVPGEDKLTEAQLEVEYERCQMAFWDILRETACEQLGVAGVYAEGRSGGWAVPHPHIDPEEEAARFREFENLCDLTLSDILENAWPEAVKQAVAEKEAAIELASRQTCIEARITWQNKAPKLTEDFLKRVIMEGFQRNGFDVIYNEIELEVS